MTDNEIIKALECCKTSDCDSCPFYGVKEDCEVELPDEALDLINRQKAEIERLQKANFELEVDRNRQHNYCMHYVNMIGKAKTEAYKEFVVKLKAHAYYIDFPKEHRVVDEDGIDNLLKEMAGGE